jgi:uncharacterized membrane protein YfcA
VIVAAVSLIGLVAHLVAGSALDGETGIAMAAGCTVGAVGGAALGCRVPQRLLGQAFALLVATVASYVVVATALGVGY